MLNGGIKSTDQDIHHLVKTNSNADTPSKSPHSPAPKPGITTESEIQVTLY